MIIDTLTTALKNKFEIIDGKLLTDFNMWSRFWAKVEKTESCWNWKGSLTSLGYGDFSSGGKMRIHAHRLSYLYHRGVIPDGMVLDHLCRNRKCVNPAHLEPVTEKENILRGVGLTAINAKKTHCIRGHKFTSENTRIVRKHRICLACKNLHYETNKAKIKTRVKKWKNDHKVETTEYMKEYSITHSEKIKKYQKEYRLKNKERIRKYANRYYQSHKERRGFES